MFRITARFMSDSAKNQAVINPNIRKELSKVVDTVNAEDLGKKTAFCRCWKSGKFPLCDGTHGKHNKETGDNVGPLVILNVVNNNDPK